MSASSTPFPALRALVLALVAVLAGTGCAGSTAADVPSSDPPSEPPSTDLPVTGPTTASPPRLVTISTEVDGPAGRSGLVVIRATVVGDRRHVVFDTPLGPMGEHVITPANHWFRLPATIAEPQGLPTDWIHVPLEELELAGIDLPPALAEVRAPLPDPAEVDVGDLLHGVRTVLAVEPADRGGARLHLDDGRVVVVRRSPLPDDTTVEPPASAIDVRDLGDLVDADGDVPVVAHPGCDAATTEPTEGLSGSCP